MEIALVSVIVVATIVLLVTELIPVDLTALGVMVALMVSGVLTPAESLAGFANAAPITVGALFIVSRGLVRTGALEYLSERIIGLTRGRPRLLFLLLLGLIAILSAFVNNTPVVVLFIGVAMAACCQFAISPSKLLIPISFMSILAGTSTLIGTSTNIIVSDLSADLGGRPLGMFELSALGVPIALIGGAFLFFFSDRLLPAHKEPVCERDAHAAHKYISELVIPEGSPWVGRDAAAALTEAAPDIELYEIIRAGHVLDPAREPVTLAPADVLLVKARVGHLVELLDQEGVALPPGGAEALASPFHERRLILELIVPPGSEFVGRLLPNTELAQSADCQVLGVIRRQEHFDTQRLHTLRLAVGDILLVQCPVDRIQQYEINRDLIVVEDVVQSMVHRRRAPIAISVFVAMVAAAALGLADILVCAVTAAFLMILGRCLSLREAYRSVDVHVLLLIIGTLALGLALKKTGAADLYARSFLSLFAGAGPRWILAAVIVLTSLLSHLLSNNSTAVLLVPIAFSTAAALGVDPRPFIVGICFGASACYASPIGYQTNLLVYGPGGYRFADYLRVGLPLNLIVWVGASLAIPWIWPL